MANEGRYEAIPYWHAASFVWRCLGEMQPQAVVISGWNGAGAWSARLWCSFHHRPSILWAESNRFDHRRAWWKEMFKSMFLKGVAAAHVYGTTNAEYLVELGFDSERIWSKRAVADIELFKFVERAGPLVNSRKVILFVGRLAPEKNLEFVLEAVQRLSPRAKESLLFRFVGYGPLDASLRRKAERLELNGLVEFVGPRFHHELPAEYHSADAVLLPSTSEPWGLTVNEAMLCGLPALVSSDCGCARDLVDASTGWSFNSRDSSEFVCLLEKIALLPMEELRLMGRCAAAVAREYSPENSAKRVIDCLLSVVPNLALVNPTLA